MFSKICKLLSTVVGLFMFIGLCSFAQPCASEAAMKCNDCIMAVKVSTWMYFAMQIIGWLFSPNDCYATFVEVIPVIGIVRMLAVIGGCSRADMACQATTFPFVNYCVVALVILHALRLVIYLKEDDNAEVTAEA